MPNKNGHDVCKYVRNHKTRSTTPLIMLSALGDDYNRLTGFEEGADDYITKPFNIDDLKESVNSLLLRFKSKENVPTNKISEIHQPPTDVELISTGNKQLDDCLYGGLPKGSNILLLGNLGKGKSTFSRQFIAQGLLEERRALFITLDDDPMKIRRELQKYLQRPLSNYEESELIKFVDAYSWSSLANSTEEEFTINGTLDLNQLANLIADASHAVGQTIQNRLGGRRIIDSITSILIHFELSEAQRFINQIARTAISFGGVTTLFILEEGTVDKQVINNIKYIMDGILEFSEDGDKRIARVQHMKWAKFKKDWVTL